MNRDTDKQAETESRRILDRVSHEAGSGGVGGMHAQPTRRMEGDKDDPIEYWGTRIGRTLGLIIAVVLIFFLVRSVLFGS